ncbi:MAG: TM1266 family iron-only hydrogenase system putative regulator [Christensenella sp.]|nr:TM1266 family iron-only hydrogenase system putative regulator [Christensenella sp.]
MNRIGIIAILIEEHRESVEAVNHILSEYSGCIHARMGVPNQEKDLYVISLVVEVTTEQLGALTGRLGQLRGVTVKSMLTNKTY